MSRNFPRLPRSLEVRAGCGVFVAKSDGEYREGTKETNSATFTAEVRTNPLATCTGICNEPAFFHSNWLR